MLKKSAPSMPMMDKDYQAEDDHRTMMRASEIQDDQARMTGVKRYQKKQVKALSRMQTMMKGGSMMKGGR